MTATTKKGLVWLVGAQGWHALSGYVIFLVAARVLDGASGGPRFGDFGLVIWTMTALETLVTAGTPKAVSYFTARRRDAVGVLAHRGLVATLALAGVLALVLVAAADLVTALWRDPTLAGPLRLSAADFVVFVPFCVAMNAINGLSNFRKQALVWSLYSTAKVVTVVTMLLWHRTLEAGVLGYVLASTIGSVEAWWLARSDLARGNARDATTLADLARFGAPLALVSVALMTLLNADQWAAKRVATNAEDVDRYVGASTLARVLFFVFVAVGDVLFPSVSAAMARGERATARQVARHGTSCLLALVLPTAGLIVGTSGPVLSVIFGERYAPGAPYLWWLTVASGGLTVSAVFCAVISACGRPGVAVRVLGASVLVGALLFFALAHALGPLGAAVGAATVGVGTAIASGWALARSLGGSIVEPRAVLAASAAGAALAGAGAWFTPPGAWVFPYGALLLGAALALLVRAGVVTSRPSESEVGLRQGDPV